MPTEPLATFHYEGGGFPLRGVSYRLLPRKDPGAAGEPAPYRVVVRVAGDPRPHVLEHRDAYRFLRDLGRLITCRSCHQVRLVADPFAGQEICDACGYRAEDRI